MNEDEYIRKQEAIDACYDGWADCRDDCAENIRKLPPADVRPVVLCKDCRHSLQLNRQSLLFHAEGRACEGVLKCCVGYDHVFVDGEHFCGFGEPLFGDESIADTDVRRAREDV